LLFFVIATSKREMAADGTTTIYKSADVSGQIDIFIGFTVLFCVQK